MTARLPRKPSSARPGWRSLRAGSAVLVICGTACTADTTDRIVVRVATWWGGTEGTQTEAEALGALEEALQENPSSIPGMDSQWYRLEAWRVDGPGAYASKQALESDERRLLPEGEPSPVHALLTNGGTKARAYASLGLSERIPLGKTSWLGISNDSFVDILNDTARLPPRLLLDSNGLPSKGEDELIGVPIETHRINTLFVNVSRLCEFSRAETDRAETNLAETKSQEAETRLRALSSLEELCALEKQHPDPETLTLATRKHPAFSDLTKFLELLSRMRDKGVQEVISLPQARSNAWVLTALTFENVMPSHVADADAFRQFWSTAQRIDETGLAQLAETLRQTLAETVELAEYTSIPEFEAEEGPNAGVHSVAIGKATFSAMGDWVAKDVEKWAHEVNGNQVVRIPFPGTANKLVYASDALVLPRDAPGRGINPARDLVTAAISPNGQAKLAATKRSLSVLRGPSQTAAGEDEQTIPGLIHIVEADSFTGLEDKTAALFTGTKASRVQAAAELAQWIVATRARNQDRTGSSGSF